MTTKEYREVLEKGMRKATVADDLRKALNQWLSWYFEYQKDDNNETVYDDDCEAVLDFTQPKLTWRSEEGDAQLAKELYDSELKQLEKWMTQLDK